MAIAQRALCTASLTYSFVFIAVIFFTWFPPDDESPFRRGVVITSRLTDPIVAPVRRVLKPAVVGRMTIDYVVILYVMLFGSIIPGILNCYRLY